MRVKRGLHHIFHCVILLVESLRRGNMKHRINNNEMNPKTECGLEMGVGIKLAWANEKPTCKECLKKESKGA